MIQATTYKKQAIKFRQWSGKNYAVFASIGEVINIGCVDIHISDKALEKNNQNNSLSVLFNENSNVDDINPEEFEFECAGIQLVSVLNLNQDDSSRHSRYLNHKNLQQILPVLPCRIWLFIVKILTLSINEKFN